MDTPIPVDLGRIAQDLQIRRVQVESVVQLLDEGNTVPFITRYRKERTGNLNEVAIREIQLRVGRLRELVERRETILKTIEAQGKLTEDLAAAIRGADNPKRLEDLYLPYKPKKRTKASEAREKGLEPLALYIWNRDESLTDLNAAATELVDAEKGLENPEQVLEGVSHILAEAVSELAGVRDAIRRVVWKTGKILTSKAESLPEAQGIEYRDYFNYSEPVSHIPPHRVLAINRGDKEGPLKVKLDVPRQELERALYGQLPLEGHPHGDLFARAAIDALDRLLLPSLEREVRRDLTEMAERHAVEVFARNLRSLLLQPPIPNQTVLAIDPGFRTGCKVAVLDGHGAMLEHSVVYPHQPQNKRYEAKSVLKDLVAKHNVGVVAIGNGTACRETEELVAEIIAEGTYFTENPGATSMPGAASAAPASTEPATTEGAAPTETPAAPAETPTQDETQAAEAPTPVAEAPAEVDQGPAPEESSNGTPAAESSEPPVETVSAHSDSASAAPSEGSPEASETLPPISGGAPDEGEEHGLPNDQNPTGAPDETPLDTVPPPTASSEEEPKAEPSEAPVASDAPPEVEAEAAAPETIVNADPGEASVTGMEPHGEAPPAPESAASDEGQPAPAPAEAAPTGKTPAAAPKPSTPVAKWPSPEFARPPKAPAKAEKAEKPEGGEPRQGGERREKSERGDQPRPQRPKGPPPPPKPHPADARLAQMAYVIVNEAGASVYSASPVGREEFPDYDATTRGTVSIGRRLQDPLAELVKIEPQNIGVGLYQHDVNPKQLKDSLETVIESCVNFVGVDLNTASVPLLRHVSGLNSLTARRVVDYRKEKGPFLRREQLQEVEGVGPVTYTQAAGFLKLRDGENPLDRTWVHPESYPAATKLLENLGFSPESLRDKDQVESLRQKLTEVDPAALARDLEVGEPTLRDILDALARPDRDPRDDLPKPIFKKGVLKLEDLAAGMELKGTVLNVVDFGAFVDIGLKDSGLVHISQLANRYIKSPHDVVSVGDVVSVWVMGVDGDRKRVSLTMVKPGTERPRGAPGEGRGEPPRGGDRGGDRGGRRGAPGGEGRPQGGGERRAGGGGGPRPPRREGQGPGPAGPGEGAGGPASPPPPRVNTRIPGPPSRSQQGGGRGGPRRPGGQGGGGGGGGRFERAQAPRPPQQPPKPSKPAPPPPPLSKDALTGNVPLRTFGQLKQLFEARTQGGDESDDAPANPSSAEASGPPQQEPNSDPQPQSDQSSN